MAMRQTKWHGRVEGVETPCSVRGCKEPGEFRAPLTPSDFDGPGHWRWLCLEHVREHNSKYNFFEGMSPDEIEAAQSPIAGWDRATRAFAHAGTDAGPAWRDFADPLDAISARFRPEARRRAGFEEPELALAHDNGTYNLSRGFGCGNCSTNLWRQLCQIQEARLKSRDTRSIRC